MLDAIGASDFLFNIRNHGKTDWADTALRDRRLAPGIMAVRGIDGNGHYLRIAFRELEQAVGMRQNFGRTNEREV